MCTRGSIGLNILLTRGRGHGGAHRAHEVCAGVFNKWCNSPHEKCRALKSCSWSIRRSERIKRMGGARVAEGNVTRLLGKCCQPAARWTEKARHSMPRGGDQAYGDGADKGSDDLHNCMRDSGRLLSRRGFVAFACCNSSTKHCRARSSFAMPKKR